MHCSELKRSLRRFFWNWNKQNASVAQLVARILGKDEVGGSSPLGSLTKTLEISCFRGFSFSLVSYFSLKNPLMVNK